VSLLWAGLIVIVVTALAITAMLLVRRGAPAGSYFEDGDRAAGVFGVLATELAILLGFVVFLAFESYDASRSGAEAEAQLVRQQFETAQFFPAPARARLSGQLVYYARNVIHQEWPAMEAGTIGDSLNPWVFTMFRTLMTVEPKSASEQTAYAKWFDQRSDREDARADRVHGAEGVIPVPLWIVLVLSAGIIFLFMLFFADSAERAVVQATMIGGVAIVISSTLLVVLFLNNPYHSGVGGLRPVAMERGLRILDQEATEVGIKLDLPCDERGAPRGG
jgi:hypothetical protein